MTLIFKINKPIDLVFDHLTDMQKFVKVHPIIYKIENKGKNEYLIFEKIRVLLIPVSFTYPAKVEGNIQTKKITINAVVKKMTEIQMHYVLENDNGKTKITETITIKTSLSIRKIIEKIFKKQHELLFKNIENCN